MLKPINILSIKMDIRDVLKIFLLNIAIVSGIELGDNNTLHLGHG